jgi:L-lactate utilization protein LutC
MSLAARKQYQNTTVRMPRHIYDRAKTVVVRSQASSFNEFVVQAIEEKVRRLTEAEIDAAFAHMAHDANYQSSSIALANEFEKSDWEALKCDPDTDKSARRKPNHDKPKTRTAKTRSR